MKGRYVMDNHMENPMEHRFIPMTSVSSGVGVEVLPDVYCFPIQVVNVSFVGNHEQNDGWVLVDAGMPGSADNIIREAEKRFGEDCRPAAIVLTHGHFDHVGAVVDLVKHWGVPVYAHKLEMPYLTGRYGYPHPDTTVEGGLVAKMSFMFPTDPVDLGDHVRTLPEDGRVPELPDWRWVHTPGHSPGHVSYFRDRDRTLLAGDAFVTVRQDSLYKVLIQKAEVNGPPRYLTTDWQAAWDSVKKLNELKPEVAVTGHGHPMSGDALADGLQNLTDRFEEIAIPDHGRYI